MTYYVKVSYSNTRLPAPVCNFRDEQSARQFLHEHKVLHKRHWNGTVHYEITEGLNDTLHMEDLHCRKEVNP